MERMTIPDVKVDEHTTRRAIIDCEKVQKYAMEFYWQLKHYEDSGLTPGQVAEMAAELERVKRKRDAAVRDLNALLRSCECEARHEFCARSDEPDGCDSDTCEDAHWRDLCADNGGCP